MSELRCVDSSLLTVSPVACRDLAGKPFEITLELAGNQQRFAVVGERCGRKLATLAARPAAARADRAQAAAWPDPHDRVRAMLTSAELLTFLDTVLRERNGALVASASTAP